MFRKVSKFVTVLLLLSTSAYAAPRAWSVNPSSSGYAQASGSAQLYTATFSPRNLTVCDDEAAAGTAMYIDFTGTTAAAHSVSAATSIKINAAECRTFTFESPNVSNTFTIAIMTAASTAAFRFIAWR